MDLTIDGRSFEIDLFDNNIIDIANRVKVILPAPCYRSAERKGCCHGCVVEIDGEHKFACSTKPMDGMTVVVDRADLKEMRKKAIKKYMETIKSDTSEGCGCGCAKN